MTLHTADCESPWTILCRQLRFPRWGVKVVELDEVKGSGIGPARRRADWYTAKVWDGGGQLGDSGSW